MTTTMRAQAVSVLFLLGLAFLSTACSVKGEIIDETAISLVETYPQQSGIVAGSTQNQVVNGYRVSASLGDHMNGMQQTSSGYTVYQSIQGNINSSASVTVSQ